MKGAVAFFDYHFLYDLYSFFTHSVGLCIYRTYCSDLEYLVFGKLLEFSTIVWHLFRDSMTSEDGFHVSYYRCRCLFPRLAGFCIFRVVVDNNKEVFSIVFECRSQVSAMVFWESCVVALASFGLLICERDIQSHWLVRRFISVNIPGQ